MAFNLRRIVCSFQPCYSRPNQNSEYYYTNTYTYIIVQIVKKKKKPDKCNLESSQAAADRLLVQLQNAVIRFFHAGDEKV